MSDNGKSPSALSPHPGQTSARTVASSKNQRRFWTMIENRSAHGGEQTNLCSPKKYHVEQQWARRDSLPMWVVCRPTTSDFSGQWTARMHLTLPMPQFTDLLIVAANLDEVRRQLPPGLINLGRQAEDDPVIEEVWV